MVDHSPPEVYKRPYEVGPDGAVHDGGSDPHTVLRVCALPLSSVLPEQFDARDFTQFRRDFFGSVLLERMSVPRYMDLSKPAESVSRPRMIG